MTYTEKEIAWGLNEWMRRFIDEPESYAQEWETIRTFLGEDNGDNNEPSYGVKGAAYLVSLISE